jgi:ABC-type uncharacterized transport system fused permease/ATPase subunit
MIDDSLVQNLKAYIREKYELLGGILPGKGSVKPFRPPVSRFGNVADDLSRFIRKERNTETFSAMLERLRLERKLSPAQLYNGAWIDKKLYSKIMGERNYHPSKNTVIAFGFSLKLNHDDMKELLRVAGFSLSASSIFDLVIMFCLENELYNLHDVNALLLSADQKVLCRE